MNNTDYLKWDAESLQELLRKKLLEQGLYTDQLYPGSDTKILLDLFAWTFDVLTYILNNNAADSLFADTMIYENMNRLVKLLSYNPEGYHTSNTTFKISINSDAFKTANDLLPDSCIIPRFTSIDTGKVDKNGNPVKYSFIQDYSFDVKSTTSLNIITPTYWPRLYNGQFKKYSTVFTGQSIPYMTFILDSINIENNIYADHNNFHIYIETIDTTTGQSIYTEWHQVNNLVLDSGFDSEDFELRLNENKKYVLTFGDNIHGKQLNNGDKIHIIYLKTNLEQGKIQNGQVSVDSIDLSIEGFKNITELVNICFNGLSNFKKKYKGLFVQKNIIKQNCVKILLSNIKESSEPTNFETVESIRINAPNSFRSGNRLVTIKDYYNYFKSKFSNYLTDLWVCNNISYTTIFYQWLNTYNRLSIDIRKYNYMFADACDFNNIYIWMKSKNKSDLTNDDMYNMISNCNAIKSATVQLIPCNAIIKYFTPFVNHIKYPFSIQETSLADFNPNIKIRIKKKPDTYFNNEQIKSDVSEIIENYFKIQNQTLGAVININELYKKIISLDYIESIQTVNIPEQDKDDEYIIDGLSFASFSVKILQGKDFNIVTYTDQLLPFQFGQLYRDNIINLIQIQNDNTYSLINTGF